jgi:FtsP/CotA-like multicopper oxidase with cupredoxin domain
MGGRGRIRIGNLSMTARSIHLYGHVFELAGPGGGPTRPESRRPEVPVDIAVGQMRQLEFTMDGEGDWAIHCHKSNTP